MAHTSLNQYLQLLDDSLRNQDGDTAAQLLSFNDPHVANPRLQLEKPEEAVQRVIESPFQELIAAHLRCIWAVSNHNFTEAHRCQTLILQSFTKILQALKDENWPLPIMKKLCVDLRRFSVNADGQARKKSSGKASETLEKAADLLMGCFRVCASDNRSSFDDTKRWGMLNLVNQLFKIYFKINKLHLCKPLIRAIDSSSIKDQFTTAELVTYRHYVGRKAMFDSDFASADEYLTYAFERCPKESRKNKRLTLIYLIPVKMLLGYLPSNFLLQKYDLVQFAEVVKAVKDGNLLLLTEAMNKNESFFIQYGVYLILEKLKVITYRNLFKKVYLLLKTHQVPIEAYFAALRFLKVEDVDIEEVECIVANLIFEGKIKGYISHQHQKLVVSKQNPFPALAASSSS